MADTNYYPFESNFDTGDFTEWTSETDTDNKFTVRHYATLIGNYAALYPGFLPFRGAYAAHLDLSGGLNDAYVQENTAFDLPIGQTAWVRFYLVVASNLVMANTDRLTLFAFQSGAGTDEAVISLYMNGTQSQLVASETGAIAIGAGTRATDLQLNVPHLVELGLTLDSGALDGQIQFWVDNHPVGLPITGLTQAAITQARLGAIGIDATTTAGHLLFDEVVGSALRVGGIPDRYPSTAIVTKSSFIALGPGRINTYSILGGAAADGHMKLYDRDIIPVIETEDMLGAELTNPNPYKAEQYWSETYFSHGVYVQLTGTSPRGVVEFYQYQSSQALIKNYARMRDK